MKSSHLSVLLAVTHTMKANSIWFKPVADLVRWQKLQRAGPQTHWTIVSNAVFVLLSLSSVLVAARADELAIDAKGTLFELDSYGKSVFKLNPDGTRSTLAALDDKPRSLAVDKSGNLFVGVNNGSIFKFGPDGTKTTFATGLKRPVDLLFDSAGNLFVGDSTQFVVLKFAPDKSKKIVATGVNPSAMILDPTENLFGGMLLDPTDNLFVLTQDKHTLLKVTPDGAKSTAASGFETPEAMAVDPSGNVFVKADPDTVYKVTPDGKKSVFATGIKFSILICDKNGDLVVAYPQEGSILKFAPDGTKSALGNVSAPAQMAFDNAGNLFVKNDNAITKVIPNGNPRVFGGDWISPDKQWEYQFGDIGDGAGFVKPGPNPNWLPIWSQEDGFVVWGPDSKRLAINVFDGPREISVSLYQLRNGKWVGLRSPDWDDREISAAFSRAKAAQIAKLHLPKKSQERGIYESLEVLQWGTADTAVLSAHSTVRIEGEDLDIYFLFTLKFDQNGNWKIINMRQRSEKEFGGELGE